MNWWFMIMLYRKKILKLLKHLMIVSILKIHFVVFMFDALLKPFIILAIFSNFVFN